MAGSKKLTKKKLKLKSAQKSVIQMLFPCQMFIVETLLFSTFSWSIQLSSLQIDFGTKVFSQNIVTWSINKNKYILILISYYFIC